MPLIIVLLLLVVFVFCKITWDQNLLLKKYRPIINIDKTIKKNNIEKQKVISQIKELQKYFKNIKKQHDIYSDNLEMISYGSYTPNYDFKDSKNYKDRLDEIRKNQKHLIREKEAIICATEWLSNGSKKQGQRMINKTIKLGLNAFNVQADNAILKVKFNNIMQSKERIEKIRDNIDKLLEPHHCCITEKFFNLKIEELKLAYEYQEKLQEEKEEQRQIKEQMKEEQRFEREREAAEKKEKMYAQALEEARQGFDLASAEQKIKYEKMLRSLEEKLAEAQNQKERAISMAQQTRQGYVYFISNIGSFGEDVYKIGMTRRLEPMDRVKELGDSSVPFLFDVHGMVYSQDAPKLEKELHRAFEKLRMNRVNNRKEFFRVTLEDIENKCQELGVKVEFTKLAEAKEYRQTLSILNSEKSQNQQENSTDDDIEEILKKAV